MAKKTKMQPGPSDEEIAERNRERIARNREVLREAVATAREAFSTDRPTVEMAVAVSQMLEGGIEKASLPLVVRAALAEADKLGARGEDRTGIAIQILDVLLDDENAEENLASARDEAQLLFGADLSAKDCLDVYFQIYGEDEPS